jgi:hypothetical protein
METRPITHPSGSETRPAGIAHGAGHLVVYGNPAFRAAFGERAVGMPARESMLGLPGGAFTLLDAVYTEGRPLACWIRRDGETWRLTAVPRRDVETGKVFGVAFHLRARDDVPILPPREDSLPQET